MYKQVQDTPQKGGSNLKRMSVAVALLVGAVGVSYLTNGTQPALPVSSHAFLFLTLLTLLTPINYFRHQTS